MSFVAASIRENPEPADFERSYALDRLFVGRIRRGEQILHGTPDTVLRDHDVAVITARRHVLLTPGAGLEEEAIGNILLTAWGPVIVLLTR